MVAAPAAAEAVERARSLPNLRVGLHVVLVDGDPVAGRSEIPALLDGAGRLRNDLGSYSVRAALDPQMRRQIEREIVAQFEAYRRTGLPLDHVNAHRHLQLHPAIAAAIVRVGRGYGMRALRIPVEPWRLIAAVDPHAARRVGRLVAPWAASLRAAIRRAGLATADAVFGLAWSGAMTRTRVAGLLQRLPPGLVEIYLHPATTDDFPGAATGYRYAEEFAALCDAECIAAVRSCGYRLAGYTDVA
jgi:chitin disaccharide deacetylase